MAGEGDTRLGAGAERSRRRCSLVAGTGRGARENASHRVGAPADGSQCRSICPLLGANVGTVSLTTSRRRHRRRTPAPRPATRSTRTRILTARTPPAPILDPEVPPVRTRRVPPPRLPPASTPDPPTAPALAPSTVPWLRYPIRRVPSSPPRQPDSEP